MAGVVATRVRDCWTVLHPEAAQGYLRYVVQVPCVFHETYKADERHIRQMRDI